MREPRERILSAFLNKFIDDGYFFFDKYCRRRSEEIKKECRQKKELSDFTYSLNRTRDCRSDHWNPQYDSINAKWWGTINFVGYMDSIAKDSKKLLQSISSSKDGVSAYERYGKTGWGTNGMNAFMERDSAHHATNAGEKLRRYYTREDEQFVKKYWASEWNNTVYRFTPFHLFDNSTNFD